MSENLQVLRDYSKPSELNDLHKLEFEADLSKVPYEKKVGFAYKLKSRDDHLKAMRDPNAQYDLLVVGGGATGAGVALDAASRGLKVAVIEKHDFASGTSTKSTKLAHGGIRYFEQMMLM